jgi:predicted AAA+ superfamily ATPase
MAFANYNPFKITATINRTDFQIQPFYETEVVKNVKRQILSDILAINNNRRPYTRLVCMGYKGVGKTSVLYYIEDLLKKEGIKAVIINSLPADLKDLQFLVRIPEFKEYLRDNYLYVLIDHPDSLRGGE